MTSIGRSLVITGELTSDEDVAIGGRMHGPISIRNGSLTIRDTARLDGDIRATRVVVQGSVDGTIAASERIELQASARVRGSLSANHVVLADGATFNGRIDMDRRTIAAKVAQYKAAQR
jgi:cytoskeletal protein CcmA (bactofilin family)